MGHLITDELLYKRKRVKCRLKMSLSLVQRINGHLFEVNPVEDGKIDISQRYLNSSKIHCQMDNRLRMSPFESESSFGPSNKV